MAHIVITDIAWPDTALEAELLGRAGHTFTLARSDEHLRELAPEADAILTCFRKVTADVLADAQRCVTVARYGVGVDNIDVAAATALGMIVSNVPDFCTEEVADHTILLALALLRNLIPAVDATRRGGWTPQIGHPSRRVRGLAIGIVGYGAIGAAVAARAEALGLRVLVHARSGNAGGHENVDLPTLLASSDLVSLHVPLTDATRGLIGERELSLMRPGSILLNVSRGGLVDTNALVDAVQARGLRAALDVSDPEPLPADHPLRSLPEVIVTPHVAFSSDGATEELITKAVANAVAVLGGWKPASLVNPLVLDSRGRRFQA